MANLDSLVNRIDALLGAERRRIEQFQRQQENDFHLRRQRLERYEHIMRRIALILTPRLRALGERFNGGVEIRPARRGHTREMRFQFQSDLAKICLRFSAFPDSDASNIIFDYDLEIVPALMKYDAHRELRQPLDEVNVTAVVEWIDDRICDFVATYLSTFQNSYYLRGHEVEDPITRVAFPKAFAAATLERQGQTYFFISPDTRDEFARRHPEPAAAERNGKSNLPESIPGPAPASLR